MPIEGLKYVVPIVASNPDLALGCDKPNLTEESASFCDQVRYLLPQMQKVAPQQTAELKRLAAEDNRQSWQRNNFAYAELLSN